MRIRKVTAHAFGPLVRETLEFADGMTVVVGDNESAKSSWHAAIYAALCGRRRGQGKPRKGEQRFIDLHKPWDGDDWLVSAEIVLDDRRRIELRQDLVGKVDCHAKDLDVGEDVSAEVMNEGTPDGALWLGLDRTSFLATACVEQTQVLRVLEGAEGLQHHLQKAVSTAGADATAAAALSLIENFQREQVGSDRVNSSRPLRRALEEVQNGKEQLAAARQVHDRYLHLAEQADKFRVDAGQADADVLAHEAAAAAAVAAEAAEHVRRAAELSAAIGDVPPAAAAEDDALAQQVTEALTSWRGQPPLPVLTGPTAAQLLAEIDALPAMPEDDLDVHISVTEALNTLRSAEERLTQLEDDQPPAPAAATIAMAASDQELADLALVLEAPATGVDAGLEAAEEAARHDLETVRGRARGATMIFSAAGVATVAAAALLASRNITAGAVTLVIALALAAFAEVRRRASSVSAAQLRHSEASAKLATAREQSVAVHRRREEAIQRCGQLGLAPDPRALRLALADRARAASYHSDLARWEKSHAELQGKATSASSELLRALSARGQRVTSPGRAALMAAVEEYRRTCVQRAKQALQAGRREHLTAQHETRQQQERRAEEDRRKRDRAATLVKEAGAACGLPVNSPEVLAAALEKWLTQRSERMAEVDETRRQTAELDALLSGRTLDDLAKEAETASVKATQLAARADSRLLAEVDPATSAERIPALRDRARDADRKSAEASGELRQFADSVVSVAEAEEALEAAEDQLRRVRQLQETLDLTRQFLEEAQNRVHRDIAPVIAATLREWLPSITAGRYTDVTVNPGTLRIDVCGPSRRWRRAELLSHGTAEQVYLLLRIAVADHLTKSHDTCPLILDDVTVHADAARKNEILALLLKIAERRQVVIFTQEQQIAEWAREHLSAPSHAIRTLTSLPAT